MCLCAKSSTTCAHRSALYLLLVLDALGLPCGAGGFAPCWAPCLLQQRGFGACGQGPHSHDSQFPGCNLSEPRLSLGFQTKPSFVVLRVYRKQPYVLTPHIPNENHVASQPSYMCVWYFCRSTASYIAPFPLSLFRVILPSIQFTNSSAKQRA